METTFAAQELFFVEKSLNLTEDRLFPSILRFSLPLIVGSVIQILFNAVDIMVLGNMADSLAVASVGATSQVTALIVNTFIGLFIVLLGLFFAPSLLRLIKCPDDCFADAVLYLRIYFFAAPFILIYNFGGATTTPPAAVQLRLLAPHA